MPYLDDNIKTVPKVWGAEEWIWNDGYCGKILRLRQAHYCSYHCHNVKDEVFYILSGKVKFTLEDETRVLQPGDRVHILPGEYHTFEGLVDSAILEVSTVHSDDDVERQYVSGRKKKVAVDLDGVIAKETHGNIYTQDYSSLKPHEYAKESMQEMQKNDIFIIIYTSRRPELEEVTVDWLEKHEIPYDYIVFGKPSADIYLDDRAKRFVGWVECLGSILGEE